MPQPLAAQTWNTLLAQAHDVADLAGSNPWIQQAIPGTPLATQNPYGQVGVSVPCHDLAAPGLTLRVTPAGPACEACGAPLDVQWGQTILGRCMACGHIASYAMPTEAQSFYPALQAVLDQAHRIEAAGVPSPAFHLRFGGPSPARTRLAGPQGMAPAPFVPSPAGSDAGVGFIVIIIAILGAVLSGLIAVLAQ
ncbi:MAG: hypothetical protein DRI90_04460 [Deltaproteobacteria bacterium]|nr:MAG: hypothetical protein DRI90_04460 [Deltaproteobacteria bacterium]